MLFRSHWVSVSAFAMGRYEVTFAEYDKFADATGRGKPDDRGWGRGNRPIINVNWHDATAYAAWLSTETGKEYRLPTEAEWEYAARAGTETKYWWGNEIGSNQANCSNSYCGDSFQYSGSRLTKIQNRVTIFTNNLTLKDSIEINSGVFNVKTLLNRFT